jgi:hypothetical protein
VIEITNPSGMPTSGPEPEVPENNEDNGDEESSRSSGSEKAVD